MFNNGSFSKNVPFVR